MIEQILETSIPGCFVIKARVQRDLRGGFTKIFHQGIFENYGLETCFAEQFYSISRRGVLRGLHFQEPPEDNTKLVCCIHGAVTDAVVDLRIGSPAYGRYETIELIGDEGMLIYIPSGVAHGFCVTSKDAIMLYNTTKVYQPQCDSGILWNSAGIPWPVEKPLVSERDSRLPPLKHYSSPFSYAV